MLIDQAGKIIRLPASEVRTMGRQAKGVRLVRLDQGQKLSSIFAFREDAHKEDDNGILGKGAIKDGATSSGVRRIVAPDEKPTEIIAAYETHIEEDEVLADSYQDGEQMDILHEDGEN